MQGYPRERRIPFLQVEMISTFCSTRSLSSSASSLELDKHYARWRKLQNLLLQNALCDFRPQLILKNGKACVLSYLQSFLVLHSDRIKDVVRPVGAG